MNGRTLLLVLIAIVISVVTVYLVKGQSTTDAGTKILVAANDIPIGSFIHSDKDLTWVAWPQASLQPSYITPDTNHIEDFNGAVARRSIVSGEPITTASTVRANEGGFMSAVLAPGMRAASIAVSLTSGNAGFLFPGDKVDLILTHKIIGKDSGDNVLASETFIEDVRVLAIDQMLDNPENKAVVAKTITLEVTPKQAEMINVATSLGTISVSLRSLSNANASKSSANTPAAQKDVPAPVATPVPSGNYSTDNDVSKLMGDKGAVRAKVSVYHGNAAEQLDFHQGSK